MAADANKLNESRLVAGESECSPAEGPECGLAEEQPPAIQVTHDALHSITLTRSCTSDWNLMSGDDQTRQCYVCGLCVHKLDNPSPESLRDLIERQTAEVRKRKEHIYRRADGTFVLADCHKKRAQEGLRWFSIAPSVIGIAGSVLLVRELHDYYGVVGAVIATVWHLLGCFLLSQTINYAARTVICLVFNLPLLGLDLLVLVVGVCALAH
jgi:hypothetical protein